MNTLQNAVRCLLLCGAPGSRPIASKKQTNQLEFIFNYNDFCIEVFPSFRDYPALRTAENMSLWIDLGRVSIVNFVIVTRISLVEWYPPPLFLYHMVFDLTWSQHAHGHLVPNRQQAAGSGYHMTPDETAYTLSIGLLTVKRSLELPQFLVLLALVLGQPLTFTPNSHHVDHVNENSNKHSSILEILITLVLSGSYDLFPKHFSHLDIRDVDMKIPRINFPCSSWH